MVDWVGGNSGDVIETNATSSSPNRFHTISFKNLNDGWYEKYKFKLFNLRDKKYDIKL